MTGAELILRFLTNMQIQYLFGNPGTTEMPMMRHFGSDGCPQFVLAAHENTAVAMADGYASASGTLGAVLLHCTGGIANGLGLVYNASRSETPLLVLVGQQSTSLQLQEPFLYSDMARWVDPLFKWSHQVACARDITRALRRAVQSALQPPRGPVCLILPMDVLEAEVDGTAARLGLSPIYQPLVPDEAALRRLGERIGEAKNPVVIAGDRIAHFSAEHAFADFIDTAQIPFYLETYPTRFIHALSSPNYQGILPKLAGDIHKALEPHDLVLVAGARVFEVFLDDGCEALPETLELWHLDQYPEAIGRNYAVAGGIAGDLSASLSGLATMLSGQRHPPVQRHLRGETLSPFALLLSEQLQIGVQPEDIVVEEGISNRLAVLAIDRIHRNTLFGEKGGTIGWGVGAAVGVALANPERHVVAVVGDGSFLLANHGLWNAASFDCSITFVVIDNGGYRILRDGVGKRYHLDLSPGFPPVEIGGIDWKALGQAFGVSCTQVNVKDLGTALLEHRQMGRATMIVVAQDANEQ